MPINKVRSSEKHWRRQLNTFVVSLFGRQKVQSHTNTSIELLNVMR